MCFPWRVFEILKNEKFNKRLLSEMLCHPDLQRLMLDTEIFVDRIADMRINDMNAVLETVRQMLLAKQEKGEDMKHLFLNNARCDSIRKSLVLQSYSQLGILIEKKRAKCRLTWRSARIAQFDIASVDVKLAR